MKTILVIDKPENCRLIDTQNKCRGCAFYYENKDDKMSCYIDDYIKDCKGACPLKPMPRKNKGKFWHNSIGKENTYVCGWNDCIDEIIGGTE